MVIGAGQAGLSAGYHLARRGFTSALEHPHDRHTFVLVDAEEGAGGAWRHRWESLQMRNLNAIFDLPGYPKPKVDPVEPSRIGVPRYFGAYEDAMKLPILRPVSVTSVSRMDEDSSGLLRVVTTNGVWAARAIINATGTWNNPVQPIYPGHETFTGRHMHTRDFERKEVFEGKRVAIVGGGISAIQLLEEISRVAETFWYTRREPEFKEGPFRPEVEGREAVAKVIADVEAGNPTGSVVSYTGLMWSDDALAAKARGVLNRRPMFIAIEPTGVREADGSLTEVDVILWATGFKPHLRHLDPLGLQNERGGITMANTQVVGEPRVHLIGFGPSQSTVGANRAGRDAVHHLQVTLDAS